jgi:hypothetical protein
MKLNCRKDLGLLAKNHRVRLGNGAGFKLASPSARRRLGIIQERSRKFLQRDKFLEKN